MPGFALLLVLCAPHSDTRDSRYPYQNQDKNHFVQPCILQGISTILQNTSSMNLYSSENRLERSARVTVPSLKRELAAQACATNLATLSLSSFNLHQRPTATNKSWTHFSALQPALPASGRSSTLSHHGKQHVQKDDKKAGAKSWVNWPDLDQADCGECV